MFNNYDVGDEVVVVGQKDVDEEDPVTGCFFNKRMAEYIGQKTRVLEVSWSETLKYWHYRLSGCSYWQWVDTWLEPVHTQVDIKFDDMAVDQLL